jgi:hypothetical protein
MRCRVIIKTARQLFKVPVLALSPVNIGVLFLRQEKYGENNNRYYENMFT